MGSLCTICAASCEQLLKSLTFGTYIKILRKAEVRPGLVRLGASGAPCCVGSGPRPSFQHHPPPPAPQSQQAGDSQATGKHRNKDAHAPGGKSFQGKNHPNKRCQGQTEPPREETGVVTKTMQGL